MTRRSSGQERSARSFKALIVLGRGVLARAEAQLVGAPFHRRDDLRDVLVEVHTQLLRTLAHLVAVHAGGERWLLELLLHGLGREPHYAGRPHHRAGGDESGELVDGEERLRHPRFTWYAKEGGVPGYRVDQLIRVAELAQLLQGNPRVAGVEVRIALVVEIVEDAGGGPQFLVLAPLARVGDHRRLHAEHVLAQRVRLRPRAEQRPGLVARHVHGRGNYLNSAKTQVEWPSIPLPLRPRPRNGRPPAWRSSSSKAARRSRARSCRRATRMPPCPRSRRASSPRRTWCCATSRASRTWRRWWACSRAWACAPSGARTT